MQRRRDATYDIKSLQSAFADPWTSNLGDLLRGGELAGGTDHQLLGDLLFLLLLRHDDMGTKSDCEFERYCR